MNDADPVMLQLGRDVRDLADSIAAAYVREEVENRARVLSVLVDAQPESIVRRRSQLVAMWILEFLKANDAGDAEALAHAGYSLVSCTETLRGLLQHIDAMAGRAAA